MTLLELLQLMRKHLKLVILLPIVCALAMGVYSYAFMANTYTASTSMYVLAKQTSANSGNAANYSNLNASQMLANDVSTLLKSDRIAADTVKNLHLDSLKGYSTKVTPWELVMPEVSDPTARRELPKAGSITGVKS